MASQDQLTFLVADSDVPRLESATQFIQELGYHNVIQAEDGPEAWAMFKNFDISFVICSLNLEEVNGLSLLKLVRSSEEHASTPFVLVAANVTAKMVTQAGRIGVSDVIVSPYQADTFKTRLKKIIEVEKSPQHVEAERKYLQGLELMKAGRYDEALNAFESILSIHEHAEIYYNMGYIKASKELYEEALECFRRATLINNDFARAYKQMAEAYLKLGRHEEAEKCLQLAGEIYMERRQDQEAEEMYQAVTRLKPDTINVYNSLGIIYRRQGRLRDAIEQYKKALLVHPTDENVYYNLSRAYLEVREFDQATVALEKSLEVNPDFTPARELKRAVEMGLTLKG